MERNRPQLPQDQKEVKSVAFLMTLVFLIHFLLILFIFLAS